MAFPFSLQQAVYKESSLSMWLGIKNGTAFNWAPHRNKIKTKKRIERKINDCNPCNSSTANESYFCMTLCVAIATVATQERKICLIQKAYWSYIFEGIAGVSALHSQY